MPGGNVTDPDRIYAESSAKERQAQLVDMLIGHCLEQAIHTAATLGLADLLVNGGRTVQDLADVTGVDPSALRVLLRALAGADVFRENASGGFENSTLSSLLLTDAPGSLISRALYYGLPQMWSVWGRMTESVSKGKSAFEEVYDMPFYEYLRHDEELRSVFTSYMSTVSEQNGVHLISSFDLSDQRTIVDVGGGHGAFLSLLMRTYPAAKGILFDLPEIVAEAQESIGEDIGPRVKLIGGDMRTSLPEGADVYLLKSVLCDWPDQQVMDILKVCVNAMAVDGQVVVVEKLVSEAGSGESRYENIMDLQTMMLFGGGGRRTREEFKRLFAAAGLTLAEVRPTSAPDSLLIGIRADMAS
jgi:hypothetical protein